MTLTGESAEAGISAFCLRQQTNDTRDRGPFGPPCFGRDERPGPAAKGQRMLGEAGPRLPHLRASSSTHGTISGTRDLGLPILWRTLTDPGYTGSRAGSMKNSLGRDPEERRISREQDMPDHMPAGSGSVHVHHACRGQGRRISRQGTRGTRGGGLPRRQMPTAGARCRCCARNSPWMRSPPMRRSASWAWAITTRGSTARVWRTRGSISRGRNTRRPSTTVTSISHPWSIPARTASA